ncbi:MAG: anthranilate phosphoribosyltransferase [Candidatus Thorarchaeota archaeon]
MIQETLQKIVDRTDLSSKEAASAMSNIMSGTTSAPQIAAFLAAIQMKGVTPDELYGFAKVMREKAVRIEVPPNTMDTCGTGGDGLETFNVSTAAAFVIAGAGVPVAKHGNRGVSSRCGSADLLEEAGISINLTPYQVEKCVNDVGIGFLFAPLFHKAMKYAMGPRQELGMRTVFNILGPLTNPARVNYQIIGVYDQSLTELLAEVLKKLGLKHALVVHGAGLDEITTTGSTKLSEVHRGRVRTYTIEPEDFALTKASLQDIKGGTPLENARMLSRVLDGDSSPYTDIVLLNAGAGLYVADQVSDIQEGIELAQTVIADGDARKRFDMLRTFSASLARGG